MPRKIHKPEEIVSKLRQVDVLVSQGQRVADPRTHADAQAGSLDLGLCPR